MGVALRKLAALPALGWWLMVVGAVRLGFLWSAFSDGLAIRAGVYSNAQVSDLHSRTVGVWTLLSCTLCFMCAFNLDNMPLCAATLLSFVYAYGHYVLELLLYRTINAASLRTRLFVLIWYSLRVAIGHLDGYPFEERASPPHCKAGMSCFDGYSILD